MKPVAFPIPSLVGEHYRVESELGHGGMATVYLARDVRHDRLVAIKVLRPELAVILGADRFGREIEIAAKLSHPNILPLYDSGEANGALYYVMPYVAGGTLRKRLDGGHQLPVEEAIRLALAVASALAAAHAAGIVHRDIKPENILLDGDRLLVADFGIARLVSATGESTNSSSGFVIGTPGYMSPEQAAGAPRIDSRSDLYSLGCVLYEMLAGERPFSGPTPQSVAMRQIHERVPSLRVIRPGVPASLEAIIERALQKSPADRYQTAESFAAALRTGPAPAPARAWRRGAGAAALVVVAAAALWLARPWGPRASNRTAGLDPLHLAVLRFQDQSDNGQLVSVADGLTVDLIGELSRLRPLHVRSVSAGRTLAGAPIDSVARTLQVGTVVEGRVSGTRDRMRIRVWLTDAASGDQFATAKWDRSVGDLFELEDQITTEIAAFLRERLGEKIEYQRQRAGTRNLAAWEAFQTAERLREGAADLLQRGEVDGAVRAFDRADSLLREVEREDRDWADPVLARGWLAVDRIRMLPEDSARLREPWTRLGIQQADHVLGRTPQSPVGLELRGTVRFQSWVNVPGADTSLPTLAERDLRAAAVPSNPNLARTWAALSHLLRVRGEFAEANQLAQQAYRADAFLRDAADVLFHLCSSSFELGRVEDALRWCRQGGRRFPARFEFPFYELMLQMRPGGPPPDPAGAWGLLARLESTRSAVERQRERANWEMMVATVLVRARLADSGAAVARRAKSRTPAEPSMDIYEAAFKVAQGRSGEAVALIARFVKLLPQMKAFVRAHPLFEGLRENAQFKALFSPP